MCKTCKGAECDLPKECPGRPLTNNERVGIRTGSLDYVNDKWVKYEDHVLVPCCDCGDSCQSDTVACNFIYCTVCRIDDRSKAGEYKLKGKCKGVTNE
jgi:hypothetical protein